MQSEDTYALGLGLKSCWKLLLGQRLGVERQPNEVHLLLGADNCAFFIP